jgi:hypothetical protein
MAKATRRNFLKSAGMIAATPAGGAPSLADPLKEEIV